MLNPLPAMPKSRSVAAADPTLRACVQAAADALERAQLSYGHGTTNAFDEAAWLVLWQLGLPLDTDLDACPDAADTLQPRRVNATEQAAIDALIAQRIQTRKPAAYLTREAWLQGVSFYVDERCIVPRSLIAEVLVEGSLDYWLDDTAHRVLDLCTGGGSLAILAAMVYPHVFVHASDISADALAVARINIERHGLHQRISLHQGDGLPDNGVRFDLILCNPPYVDTQAMRTLPPEFQAEPALALDGNRAGASDGMDFIRQIIPAAVNCLRDDGILVLEVGHNRAAFEAAFPTLEVFWQATSAGDDQVLLVTRAALQALADRAGATA
ncbi:MAG: 50S ribosomal protein L3 N(5)-glutamine methyltransferase [Rhodoferax sp.]